MAKVRMYEIIAGTVVAATCSDRDIAERIREWLDVYLPDRTHRIEVQGAR